MTKKTVASRRMHTNSFVSTNSCHGWHSYTAHKISHYSDIILKIEMAISNVWHFHYPRIPMILDLHVRNGLLAARTVFSFWFLTAMGSFDLEGNVHRYFVKSTARTKTDSFVWKSVLHLYVYVKIIKLQRDGYLWENLW